MQELEDNSIDLILTDPPYYKVKGEAWDRQWDNPALFIEWIGKLSQQWERILKPNGSLYVFASPKMAARVEVEIGKRFNVLNNIRWQKPPYSTKAEMFNKDDCRKFLTPSESIIFAEHYSADNMAKGEAGYAAKCDELRGFVFEPLRAYLDGERQRAGVSNKQVDTYLGNQMSGHYFTQTQWTLPTEKNYNKMREALSQLNHGGEYLKRDYEDLRTEYEDLRTEYEDLRTEYESLRRPFSVSADVPYTDVWTFKTVSYYKDKHPCEKPEDMIRHIIKSSTRAGAVVLDCFMGTGVTGKVSRDEGLDFIGIEKDPKYFAQAKQKIEQVQYELKVTP